MILTAVEWLTLVAVIALLFAIVKSLIGRDAKLRDEQIKRNEERVDEVERNYIKKFDEVKDCVNDTQSVLLEAIGDIKIDIAKNYVTKSECRYVQEQAGK